MAGVNLKITGIEAVKKRLSKLFKAGGDLTGPMAKIGEELLVSHRQRFNQGIAPYF